MKNEVLQELWDAKDSIAKEHGYSIDALAAYYLAKQAGRHSSGKGGQGKGGGEGVSTIFGSTEPGSSISQRNNREADNLP